MATYTNYLTLKDVGDPPHGKDRIRYYHKSFYDYISADQLDLDINEFLEDLAQNGKPWPHLVDIDTDVYPNPISKTPRYFAFITYMLVG